MKFLNLIFVLWISIIFITSCKNYEASIYHYPDPVDTSNKPIQEQAKKTWEFDGVYTSNQFDGARLNDFEQLDKHNFKATILPENTPINKSPWFAFKIWSEKKRQIFLTLDYTHAKHRYIPKLSSDKINWELIDTNSIFYVPLVDSLNGQILVSDSSDVRFPLMVGPDTLYISGQEIVTSLDNKKWIDTLALSHDLIYGTYGTSVKGRDLFFMDIHENSKKDKPMVVLLSRQHPPEISGYFAMRQFVHAVLDTNVLASSFREKYRILVLPMLNPDGVDMGHWRHNAHGIDLNRDWGVYRQPEIKQAVDFIVRESKMNKNEVVLGIDFHSTQKDVFYTYVDSMRSVVPGFKDFWIYGIGEAMPDHEPLDEPSGLTQPYSKVWFYTQFGAEAITYEIGDETDRDFIERKAKISANEMMKLLMFYGQK